MWYVFRGGRSLPTPAEDREAVVRNTDSIYTTGKNWRLLCFTKNDAIFVETVWPGAIIYLLTRKAGTRPSKSWCRGKRWTGCMSALPASPATSTDEPHDQRSLPPGHRRNPARGQTALAGEHISHRSMMKR